MSNLKERHGCVSAWLWFAIIINLCVTIYYATIMFESSTRSISLGFGLASILSTINILGVILLMRWNKCGFYLFIISALSIMAVNITLLDMKPYVIVSGFFAILIWWAILHIKKNGISAWKMMERGWNYRHCRHLYQVFGCVVVILLVLTIIEASGYRQDESYNTQSKLKTSADVDNQNSKGNSIVWMKFSDANNICSIEAPRDFRKAKLNEGQVMGLMCSDYDPALFVIRETVSSLEPYGITTPRDYANVLIKMNRHAEGISDFKKVSEKFYNKNSFLVVYELSINNTSYRYNLLTTRTKSNFYYCMVYCLCKYSRDCQMVMSHMLSSFKCNK